MSPVEKLEAAIKELEESEGHSFLGKDLDTVQRGFRTYIVNRGETPEDEGQAYTSTEDEDVAHLIVLLARTIDAQIDFMRFARSVAGAQMTGDEYGVIVDFGLQLASAILGAES